ncbi:MAG: hypothetical protein JO297_16300 [Nitrososphaeraceae archaeon]|nr:hypothetical protein [Nitrososphaeraceae archaeon]
MHSQASVTTAEDNQKQLLSYKNHFLFCQSCSWKITYFDQSGKIGNIPDEKPARCPICTTGIIIES